MYHCILCGFDAPRDDALVCSVSGRCICLRCWTRETGTMLVMSKALRCAVEATVNAAV